MHFQFRLNMLIEELPVLPRHFTGKGGRRTPTGINDDRDAMFRLSRLALILSSALVAAPAAAQLVPGETPTEDQVTSGEVLAAEPAPPAVEAVPVIALPPMPVAAGDRTTVCQGKSGAVRVI